MTTLILSSNQFQVASQRLFHQLDTSDTLPGSEPDTPDDPTSPEPDRKVQTPVQGKVNNTILFMIGSKVVWWDYLVVLKFVGMA